jgi:protein transport protein SEC20
MASFETLQERLAALQETTAQLQGLIERLATIKFQPGSVPLPMASLSMSMSSSVSSLGSAAGDAQDEDPNVATELSGEISQILREEEEELELLREEIIDLRAGRPGSEAEHRKARLREGVQRLEGELEG